jgi:hypothetical protein
MKQNELAAVSVVFTKRYDPSEGPEAATCPNPDSDDNDVVTAHPITEDLGLTTEGKAGVAWEPFLQPVHSPDSIIR